jgi:hypothetical protein
MELAVCTDIVVPAGIVAPLKDEAAKQAHIVAISEFVFDHISLSG